MVRPTFSLSSAFAMTFVLLVSSVTEAQKSKIPKPLPFRGHAIKASSSKRIDIAREEKTVDGIRMVNLEVTKANYLSKVSIALFSEDGKYAYVASRNRVIKFEVAGLKQVAAMDLPERAHLFPNCSIVNSGFCIVVRGKEETMVNVCGACDLARKGLVSGRIE